MLEPVQLDDVVPSMDGSTNTILQLPCDQPGASNMVGGVEGKIEVLSFPRFFIVAQGERVVRSEMSDQVYRGKHLMLPLAASSSPRGVSLAEYATTVVSLLNALNHTCHSYQSAKVV